MADDDVKTEDKPVSPFAADGDSKVGETAAEHEAAPDPAQPASQPPVDNDHIEAGSTAFTDDEVALSKPALQQADDAPVAAGHEYVRREDEAYIDANGDHAAMPFYAERENPVATEGTTEVSNEPAVGYQFADPNDPIRQRYAEMERKKDEDIAELVKMGDGKPKV